MIALEQARHYMETLGLTQAAAVLDSRLDAATQKQLSYPEVLADLLGIEAAARRERYLTTRTRLAHLPFHRTLEQFDFGFQPSVDKRQVRELASMAFVSDAANLLLLGPSRSGEDTPGHRPGHQGHRAGVWSLLHSGLRPNGGPP